MRFWISFIISLSSLFLLQINKLLKKYMYIKYFWMRIVSHCHTPISHKGRGMRSGFSIKIIITMILETPCDLPSYVIYVPSISSQEIVLHLWIESTLASWRQTRPKCPGCERFFIFSSSHHPTHLYFVFKKIYS